MLLTPPICPRVPQQVLLRRIAPALLVRFDYSLKVASFAEVQGQVRRQDRRLDVLHGLLVIARRERLQQIVALGLQDHDALVEMVMLQCRRGVEFRQGRVDFRLEGVVRATMVQIVTQAGDEETDLFDVAHVCVHPTGLVEGAARVQKLSGGRAYG